MAFEATIADHSFCVGIPAYNESENIGQLLEGLLSDPRVNEIIIADDMSTDGTEQIVAAIAARDSRVRLLRSSGRAGQVAGWLSCARATTADSIVFIDADSTPDPGAVVRLARSLEHSLIVSGRIEPYSSAGRRGGRFSAALLDRVRRSNTAPAIIGRFFAVKRTWFLEACDRTDIIANDMWLACLAMRTGRTPRYVPQAVVRYVPPSDGAEFAAQRQRADAGTKQLRELGVLEKQHLPGAGVLLNALAYCAYFHGGDLPAWVLSQLAARLRRYYKVPAGMHAGIWEPQTSTKRRV